MNNTKFLILVQCFFGYNAIHMRDGISVTNKKRLAYKITFKRENDKCHQ